MTIHINVVQDFENYILNQIENLKRIGFIFETYENWKNKHNAANLAFFNKSEEEKREEYKRSLINNYSNLCQRLITRKKRKIIYSKNFECKQEYIDGLRLLEKKIVNGLDLTPHLSRQIFMPNFSDGMLFDFGIQHFHLGVNPDSRNSFLIEGRSEILYAFVTEENVFFICIDEHGRWGDSELLKTVQNEFPEAIDKWELKDIKSISPQISETERIELRRKGVNSVIELNGKFYMSPGGGFNTLGSSINGIFDVVQSYHFYRRVEDNIRKWFDDNKKEIQEELKSDYDFNFKMISLTPLEFYDKENHFKLSYEIKDKKNEIELTNRIK